MTSSPSGSGSAGPSRRTSAETSTTPASQQLAHTQGTGSVEEKSEVVGARVRGGMKDFGFLPIPRRLQYDSENAFRFTALLNVTFGLASTFTVANLYYCQPLLIQLASSFGVSHEEVSKVPTLVQAGYATGLLLLSPLGDLVRRRPLLLLLVTLSTALTIGLAVTSSFTAFLALSFLVGVFTVTPQVLIPLAADLAPPSRRASAISIVLAGLLFGILIARVLAGVVAQFASWRVVFYMSIGLQATILVVLYAVLPDWPAKNAGMGYARILGTMAKYAATEPVLMQAGLMQFCASACFNNFWVTLTFLLGGDPYNFSTLDIGLFGLVGMLGVCTAPLVGRLVDRLVPWYATLIATLVQLVFQAVQTGAGGINIGAVVVACFGLDVGRQMQQVSLTTAVYNISGAARARMNAVLIIWIFLGQVTGTAAGTAVFLSFGWRASAALAMGLYAFSIGLLLLRGPHCERYTWIGYEGGWGSRKGGVSGGGVEGEDREEALKEKGDREAQRAEKLQDVGKKGEE